MSNASNLGWTFDTAASTYEKMRPGYLPQLYRDIFSLAPINGNCKALEIGIGGGQATLPILQTGCAVTAVECGVDLGQICREKFKDYPDFSVATCKFEDFDGQANHYDLIYSATAFHWIPEALGYQKVFALLKSGGVFARFANHPYIAKGCPRLFNAIQEIYGKYMPRPKAPVEYTEDEATALADIGKKYGFIDTSHRLYNRTRSFSASEYIALLSTYSDHIAIEQATRLAFFKEIEDVINEFGGQITIYDTIDLQLAKKP